MSRHKGSRREIVALDTLVKLSRAVNSVQARLAQSPVLGELTLGQFAVLEALHHLGPLPQKQLGQKLLSSGSNICMVLDNLERDGLVQRVRVPEDRRQVVVHLTTEGERKIAAVFPAHAEAVAEVFGALDEGEQLQLGALCKKLGLSLREEPGSEPPRLVGADTARRG